VDYQGFLVVLSPVPGAPLNSKTLPGTPLSEGTSIEVDRTRGVARPLHSLISHGATRLRNGGGPSRSLTACNGSPFSLTRPRRMGVDVATAVLDRSAEVIPEVRVPKPTDTCLACSYWSGQAGQNGGKHILLPQQLLLGVANRHHDGS
jgi:hypothetical protein